MPDLMLHTREGDKPAVMLMLADCGARDGLSEEQQEQLNNLRLAIANACETLDRSAIRAAKADLLAFYEALPEIKNGENSMTAEQALNSDVLRLKGAVRKYDPNDRHPNYGDVGYKR